MNEPVAEMHPEALSGKRGAGTLAVLALAALATRVPTLWLGTDVDTGWLLVEVRAMAEGKALYKDIFSNLAPLPFWLGRALYGASPEHFVALTRLFMILASASCALPVYWLALRLFGRPEAICAAVFYIFDPLSVFYGRQLHAGNVEVVAATWAVFVMALAVQAERRRGWVCLLAGMSAALAFLAKQPSAALFALFPVLSFLFSPGLEFKPSLRRVARDLPAYALGAAVVVGAALAWLWRQGALADAWYGAVAWNFHLRGSGVEARHVGGAMEKLRRLAVIAWSNRWLWLFAFCGIPAGFRRPDRRVLIPLVWLALLAAFFLAFYFEASDHYVLPWTGPICLLAGLGFMSALSLGRRSIEEDALGEPTLGILWIMALCLGLAGVKFAHMQRVDYGAFMWALTALAALRIVLNGTADGRTIPPWRATAAGALTLLLALCAVTPYFAQKHPVPEPYIDVPMEKLTARWVRERLAPGEDVANIASSVLTIYGGWRDLPVVKEGRVMIHPMGVADSLRDWSGDPRLLTETLALWERDYRVRALVIFERYWEWTALEQNRPLRDYIQRNFELAETVDWKTGDYYGEMRVYVRPRAPERLKAQGVQ